MFVGWFGFRVVVGPAYVAGAPRSGRAALAGRCAGSSHPPSHSTLKRSPRRWRSYGTSWPADRTLRGRPRRRRSSDGRYAPGPTARTGSKSRRSASDVDRAEPHPETNPRIHHKSPKKQARSGRDGRPRMKSCSIPLVRLKPWGGPPRLRRPTPRARQAVPWSTTTARTIRTLPGTGKPICALPGCLRRSAGWSGGRSRRCSR